MSEEEIIQLFAQRSEKAIEILSQKYMAYCKKISMSILKNKEDVEECLNDCWLTAWNTIPPQPSEPKLLGAYVYRIARNSSLKKQRYNTAKKRNSTENLALDELLEVLPALETAETTILASELTSYLNLFLENLDKESNAIFVLRYWFHESSVEIAEQLNLKPNTVNVKLKRIRVKLKVFLTEKELLE